MRAVEMRMVLCARLKTQTAYLAVTLLCPPPIGIIWLNLGLN